MDPACTSSELEDLAAAAGIEIVQENTEPASSRTTVEGDSLPVSGTVVRDPKEGQTEGCVFPADIMTRCSQDHLTQLEQLFCHRYTTDDEDFAHTVETGILPPPCIPGWWVPSRNFDRSRNRQGQGHWRRGEGDRPYRDRGDYSHRSHGHHEQQRYGHYRDHDRHYQQSDRHRHYHRDRSPHNRY